MIITICLLILFYSFLKKPVGSFVHKLKDVNWKELASDAWGTIVKYSKRIGRAATRYALKFYYVMQDDKLSAFEKALVYAGIVYIAVPSDLLPERILGLLGLVDDAAVVAWIYKRIEKSITPEVERKVEDTLNDWFGPEIVTDSVADFR